MNVYLTGDTHGRFERFACFCRNYRTTREDVLIILGDAGVNHYRNHRDEKLKQYIAAVPITLLCIHGNHEARPTAALGYEPTEAFLPFVDQSTVDTSTEQWLDEIERRLRYTRWYAGHFHTTKTVDKLRLMYQDYVRLGGVKI